MTGSCLLTENVKGAKPVYLKYSSSFNLKIFKKILINAKVRSLNFKQRECFDIVYNWTKRCIKNLSAKAHVEIQICTCVIFWPKIDPLMTLIFTHACCHYSTKANAVRIISSLL